jgi:hypothetical protein
MIILRKIRRRASPIGHLIGVHLLYACLSHRPSHRRASHRRAFHRRASPIDHLIGVPLIGVHPRNGAGATMGEIDGGRGGRFRAISRMEFGADDGQPMI